jgi:lantibiotic modifying enzyme
MSSKSKWQILLTGDDAAPVRKKLEDIAKLVPEHSKKMKEAHGIMGGKAGVALFCFYYAQMMDDDSFADLGLDLISEIFDAINEGFAYHTHAGGLAGIGWTVEHLAKHGFLDTDTDEILGDLDPYLHKAMIYDIDQGNFDFLHGAVGNGTYFLNRLSSPKAKDYIKELIDKMDEKAHRDDDGAVKWLSTLNHEEGTKGYNLSLSHGLASIIAFLGKLLEEDIYKDKAGELLDGSIKYLLKQELEKGKFKSRFPSWISTEHPLTESRLAWCYGDLGVGIALWQAAQSAKNKEWEKIASDTLLLSTARKDLEENSVIDAGLCHGAAGIMHIYNRAYQYTGIKDFKDLALYWAKVTLDMATHEDGHAGYKAWHTEKYGGWVAELGFLEGVTGIGLGLISMVSDITPAWDRTLFIS